MSEKVTLNISTPRSSTLRGRPLFGEETQLVTTVSALMDISSSDELNDMIRAHFTFLLRANPSVNMKNLVHYLNSKKLKVFIFTKYYDNSFVRPVRDEHQLQQFKTHLNHQRQFWVKLIFLKTSGLNNNSEGELKVILEGHARSFESFFDKYEPLIQPENHDEKKQEEKDNSITNNLIDTMIPYFESISRDINDAALSAEALSETLGCLIEDKLKNVYDMISCLQDKMEGLSVKGLDSTFNEDDFKLRSHYEHPDIACDSCNEMIRGIRYNCLECNDFDLCEICEKKDLHLLSHSPDHQMLKIPKPNSPIRPHPYSVHESLSLRDLKFVLNQVKEYFLSKEGTELNFSNKSKSSTCDLKVPVSDRISSKKQNNGNTINDVIELLYIEVVGDRLLKIGLQYEPEIEEALFNLETFNGVKIIDYSFSFMDKDKNIVIDLLDETDGRFLDIYDISSMTINIKGEIYKFFADPVCNTDCALSLVGSFVPLNSKKNTEGSIESNEEANIIETTKVTDIPFELLYYNEINSLGDVNLVVKTSMDYQNAVIYGINNDHVTSKEFSFINGIGSIIVVNGFKDIYIHIDKTNELFKLDLTSEHEGLFQISDDDIFTTNSGNSSSFIVPLNSNAGGTQSVFESGTDDDEAVLVDLDDGEVFTDDSLDITDYEVLSAAEEVD